jgi:hypothetical protein
MHEVAGARIDVAQVALELELERAAHDLQTSSVALVVVTSCSPELHDDAAVR